MRFYSLIIKTSVIFLIISLILSSVLANESATIWTTDSDGNPQTDFSPEEIVYIHGEGFLEEYDIDIDVTRPDSTVDSDSIISESDGTFVYEYNLNGITGEYLIEATDETNYAQTTFTDKVCNYDVACSNDDPCYYRCGDGKYWYYGSGYCSGSCWSGGTKHCRYDYRKCDQTCGATCDEDSDCPNVCDGKETKLGDCRGDCTCGVGSARCVQGSCGATCEEDSDCDAGEKCINCECHICSVLLDDGFEGSPWDDKWNGNGVTPWDRSTREHTGTYSAHSGESNNGNLVSDDLNASGTDVIYIDFWWRFDDTEDDEILLYFYNGASYVEIYDLDHGDDDEWHHYTDEVTDNQYFKSNFRVRFSSSVSGSGTEEIWVDDVLITKCSAIPVTECGNGIVEIGEDCDPGANNPNDCCDSNCMFELNTYNCRPSTGDCDLAEQCTGSSADCPADQFQPLSTPCEADGQFCTVDHCDGSGSCVYLEDYDCSDGDECTDDICNEGLDCCENPDLPDGTSCPGDPGICCSGVCDNDGTSGSDYHTDCRSGPSCIGVGDWSYSTANEGDDCDSSYGHECFNAGSCDGHYFYDICSSGYCDGTPNEIEDDTQCNDEDCGTCCICDNGRSYDETQDNDCPDTICLDGCNIDTNPFTWDYANDEPNYCEDIDTCTNNDCKYNHECHDNDPNDGIDGNLCGASCDQHEDCSQSTSMCDYVNKEYCTRDDYGTCDGSCECVEDSWDCKAEDYCLNCNHCGDGEVNCGEECEPGDIGNRCMPEGTSSYLCINKTSYQTPDYDSCKDTCIWDNCETKEIIENDPRCDIKLVSPACDSSNPLSSCYSAQPYSLFRPISTITQPSYNFIRPTFNIPTFTIPTFNIPTFDFSSLFRR